VALIVQWAQEHGEVGGVLTSHTQLTGQLRDAGHEVRYIDTGSPRRATGALLRLGTRSALHLFHITRLWRAVVLAPVFAVLRGRTVLVLHSGSTLAQVQAMSRPMRALLGTTLHAYDEIWAVNAEIKAVLPASLVPRAVVVVPFDDTALPVVGVEERDPHALALATNAGLPHYNADLGVEAARIVRKQWPDATLHILAYGSDGPAVQRLRDLSANDPWITLTFDLPPGDMSRVLRHTGCFLRPTSWDGDSVIVREALASGARVVASDRAPRPRGVELAALTPGDIATAVLEGGPVSDGARLAALTMLAAAGSAIDRLETRR
jgi:glycosyltransferase involved in cell wall biosynthesis